MAIKQGLIGLLSAALVCTSLSGCANKEPDQKKIESIVENKVKEMIVYNNPLLNTETYEIEPGIYRVFIEGPCKNSESQLRVCSPPFKDINIPGVRAYLKRLDSKNAFKTPLKISRDSMMNQYTLEKGDYEVWIENRGYFAPFDTIKVDESHKKEFEDYKIKLFNPNDSEDNRKPALLPPEQEQNKEPSESVNNPK